MEIPKVFVSYSHDSDEHKEWVLQLSTRLRQNGVDVILDRWDLGAGDDMTLFMEKGVRDSDLKSCDTSTAASYLRFSAGLQYNIF